MMAVMGRPPQRSALHGAGAHEREHKLHAPPAAKSAMGEVAVVAHGDAQHANRVGEKHEPHGEGTHLREEDQ